jgi:Arc/MetJ family transcription regulator
MAVRYTISMRKRTTIWLDESDRAALAKIRQRYGVARDSDAVRLALRLLAESKRVNVEAQAQDKPKTSPRQGETAAVSELSLRKPISTNSSRRPTRSAS